MALMICDFVSQEISLCIDFILNVTSCTNFFNLEISRLLYKFSIECRTKSEFTDC